MEYVAGSFLAILLSFGFTQIKSKKLEDNYLLLQSRVEELELDATKTDAKLAKFDTDIARKVVGAVVPLSKSLKDLKEFTGMQ